MLIDANTTSFLGITYCVIEYRLARGNLFVFAVILNKYDELKCARRNERIFGTRGQITTVPLSNYMIGCAQQRFICFILVLERGRFKCFWKNLI